MPSRVQLERILPCLFCLVMSVVSILPIRLAPLAAVAALVSAAWPLARVWRGSRGTTLRAAVIWAGIAIAIGILSQIVAIGEPIESGRPISGRLTYLTIMATLACMMSVFGARTPGQGAWAILMVMLIVVFLIPWLEGGLRLYQPWSLFYGLLVIAGVTNYLPTRYILGAVCLLFTLFLEYLVLTQPGAPKWRASFGSFTLCYLAFSVAIASQMPANRFLTPRSRFEAIWFWFRDHWGVVWALRVQERFNQSAAAQSWPIRLTWHGVVGSPETGSSVPEGAEETLITLLRRFATPERIREAVADFPP